MDHLVTVIDEDDWNEAINDPRVHELHRRADALAQDLISRGHCPCHLVVEQFCPNTRSNQPSN
jgi:hypothetical protein